MALYRLTTTGVCSCCMNPVPAVKQVVGTEVYLEKHCPIHGTERVKIAKDSVRFFDETFAVEGKPVHVRQTAKENGCPSDCGLCPDHKQHLCTGLIEITDRCNLSCPICYSNAKNGSDFAGDLTVAEFEERLETLLQTEGGKLDVLQISGGEPTVHPHFEEILDLAASKNVGRILVNTNGLRFLEDGPIHVLEKHRDKAEVYLQFDGFDDEVYRTLRNRPLCVQKQQIVERLDRRNIKISLTATIGRANLKEIPAILDFACRVESITGVTFQRLTRVGRAKNYETIFQEDILYAIGQSGFLKYDDLIPLPCSHANCTSIGFLFRSETGKVYSLADYVDYTRCKEMLSDRIALDRSVLEHLKKNTCCCFAPKIFGETQLLEKLREFSAGNGSSYHGMKVVRILVKNFMDAETFDTQRARQCCVGVAVGGNRIIPFCVHNLFRT